MKGLRLVTLAVFIGALGLAGLAVAEMPDGCSQTGLNDNFGPSGQYYHIGDHICYEISFKIDPNACDIENALVTFWSPAEYASVDPDNICGSPGGAVLDPALYIPQTPVGDPPIIFNCGGYAALDYTVAASDVVLFGGYPAVLSHFCVDGDQLVGPPPLPEQDEKASINWVLAPCIEVHKEVCGYSKEGDTVTYTIWVKNCSDASVTGGPAIPTTLYNVVVNDPLLGGDLAGFPVELAPGQESAHLTFDYVVPGGAPSPLENTVTASGDDISGFSVSDIASASVTLLNPAIDVTVECQGGADIGADATFLVTLYNNGDVALDFTTDDTRVGPFTISAFDSEQVYVDEGPMVCPEICYTINIEARIPSEFCDLPNVLDDTANDCCPCICNPCIEIEKSVDCDISKVGDDVIYTIQIKNCGDIELTDVVVTDLHISPDPLAGFPSPLPADDTWYSVDFTYTVEADDDDGQPYPDAVMTNQAHVAATGLCGDVPEYFDKDSEIITVYLIHPDFTISKTCMTNPVQIGGTAEFEVVVTNTGDVPLDFTATDGIAPFSLDPDGIKTEMVFQGPATPPEECNTVSATATIPQDGNWCDLQNTYTKTADDCCPVECNPCIEIEKSVDCDISKVGDDVIYTIQIKNCGDIELTDVVVTDLHISPDPLAGFPSPLPADDTWYSVDFTYTVEADDDDGQPYPDAVMTNQAHVAATGLCGDVPEYFDKDSEIITVYLIHPDFTISKTCMTNPVQIGGTAEFEVVVTNTGDVPLDFTATDGIAPFSLDPDGIKTEMVFQGPATPPEECNTVSATATIPQDGNWCDLQNTYTKTADDCCPVECNPCIEIEKSVDCDISKVGDDVIYTIQIKNCGDIELTDVVVTDLHISPDPLAGFPSPLPADDTWYSVDFTYTVEADDDDGQPYPDAVMTNQAHVAATGLCGDVPEYFDKDSEIITVYLIHPDFTISKTCMTNPVQIGGTAEFEVVVTNTGDVPLDFTATDGIAPFSLDPDGIKTEMVFQGPATPPEECNTVSATATIPQDGNWCDLQNTYTKTADDCCPVECNPCIEIEKSVDCDISKVGDDVIYTIQIKNCGDIELTDVVVTDLHISPDPLAGFPSPLPADDTWYSVDFTYTVEADDDDGLPYPDAVMTNQAHVAATGLCGDVPEDVSGDSEIITVYLIHPDFTVTKECVDSPLPSGATEAWYTVTVTNTGDVPLDFTADDGIAPFSLDPDGVMVANVSVPVPAGVGEICNTVNVEARIPQDGEWCDLPNVLTDSATACCEIAGEHGCTPGYWKNQTECWECYSTSTPICDVFTFPAGPLYDFFCGGNVTLHKALKFGGGEGVVGKARNLMRHGVAALLNACDADVNYGMDTAGVIAMVNDALATEDPDEITSVQGVLAGWNERGCSQDAHCNPQDPEDDGFGATPAVMPDDILEPGGGDLLQSGMAVPREFSVRGYPNPAGTSASIRYAVPMDSKVTVEILDIQGRLVTKLLDQQMPAGSHTVVWDGDGSPAGVYFCRVQCCDGKETVSKVIKVQ